MSAKVLYIDDELDILELASSFFEDENLPIETCSDFHEALDLIRKNPYEVIISDAKMPSGSGYELFSIIRAEGRFKGKIILVTGNVEKNSPREKKDYDLLIYKPIDFADLIDKVKGLLSK
jgi:CheY-like chemotaxis protein